MKKLLALALVALMAFAMVFTAYAAEDNFIDSRAAHRAPTLVNVEDWNGQLIITPHAERDTLPADLQILMEKAYKSIVAVSDVAVLNAGLADKAKALGVTGADLAVSALFDIHIEGVYEGSYDIVLDTTDIADADNFVALIHYNGASWDIEDATISGTTLEFNASNLSPFGIVVLRSGVEKSPQTSDMTAMLMTGAVVFGILAVACFTLGGKKKFAA